MKSHRYAIKKKRIAALALPVCIYLIYLLAANIFLNLDHAHNLINRHPEQRRITWENGYSFFPGFVSLSGFQLEVNKKRNDWVLSLDQVSGRFSLLPLMQRIFRVSNLTANGLDFEYQRRNVPHDHQKTRRKKKPWILHFDDFLLNNVGRVEIQDYLLKGSGQVQGTLHMVTRGEMQLFPSMLKMRDIILLKGDQKLAEGLNLELNIQTDPFVPSVDRGRKSLQYFIGDLDFEGELSEYFVPKNIFKKLDWLKIEDYGLFHGLVSFNRGSFMEGSRFGIIQTKLQADYNDLSVHGSGQLDLVLKKASTPWDHIQNVDLEVRFLDFKVRKTGLPTPLITGNQFLILAESNAFSLEKHLKSMDIRLEMKDAKIPEIKHMNSFLHTKDFFSFESGSALASGHFLFLGKQNEGGGWLSIESEHVKIALKDNPFSGRFEFRAHFSEFRPGNPKIMFTGSSIKLENPQKAWYSNFILTKGFLTWPKTATSLPGKQVLKNAEGEFKLTGQLSDIGFINPFLRGINQEDRGFHLKGAASLNSDLVLAKGDLQPGTSFKFDVPEITASFIGYQAKGTANLTGGIKRAIEGKERKKAHVDLVIYDYTVSRKGLNQEHSEGNILTASIRLPNFSLTQKKPEIEMKINLPQNTIKDMSSYNVLFGENASFQILSGTGNSMGKLYFSSKSEQLTGTFELQASDLKASFESLPLTANFKFKGQLKSQNLKEMIFGLKGSTIHLDHVTTGSETPEENWKLAVGFDKTQLIWQNPILLKGHLNLKMTDTAPIISLFAEKKRILKYVNKVLTIKDIEGECDFDLNQNFLDIPELEINGEELYVLGKSRINRTSKKGAVLIQYKRISFMLSLEDDKKRIHLFQPQRKFEQFPVFQDSMFSEKTR